MPIVRFKKKRWHFIRVKRAKRLPRGSVILIPVKKYKKRSGRIKKRRG